MTKTMVYRHYGSDTVVMGRPAMFHTWPWSRSLPQLEGEHLWRRNWSGGLPYPLTPDPIWQQPLPNREHRHEVRFDFLSPNRWAHLA
jgi:hypothetical protein